MWLQVLLSASPVHICLSDVWQTEVIARYWGVVRMHTSGGLVIERRAQRCSVLKGRDVDTTRWGVGDAKSVADLWRELKSGECQFAERPLRRVLTGVARLVIRREGRLLIESEQELSDGRMRLRRREPAEKMKQGEHYLDAVRRCLEEELGVSRHRAEVLEHTLRETRETRASPSYPGLVSVYRCHAVEVRVPDLPGGGDFWTDEASSGDSGTDPIRRHRWSWREDR